MRKQAIPGKSRRGTRPGEQRLLTELLAALRSRLPATWSIESQTEPIPVSAPPRNMRPDAIVTIRAPDGTAAEIVVEAKAHLDSRGIRPLTSQVRLYQQALGTSAGLIISSYLSPRARDILGEEGLSYADSTGNLRVALDRPAVFIHTDGASADPWAADLDRPLRSLRGPTASRIVRALIDFRPPFGVQQLAERSKTSLGSVSRVFTLLELEGLIIRERYGPVTDVRWADLIHRWTFDYNFARSNRTQTFLEPRALPALLDKLRAAPWRYAVTGSLAAADLAPIATSRLAAIYVDDATDVAERLRLRPADAGANVILAEPFDSVVYDRTREVDSVRYAAPSQVAADLLTGPGRSPAEGEELIRWMQQHEHAWCR